VCRKILSTNVGPVCNTLSMIETRSFSLPPRPISRYQVALLGVATVLIALGCAGFLIDLPVAIWCKTHRLPGEIGRLINLLEITGHSLGAAIVLIAVVTLDRSLRIPLPGRFGAAERIVLRMIAATYFGGLLVDLIKISVVRVRPRAADLASVASPFGTFGDDSLAVAAPHLADLMSFPFADLMSFPSGHSAVAAGLAAALTWRYPHGAPLFVMLAAAAALQRVVTSAHYPSDVACGAAMGLIGAACCLGGPRAIRGTMAATATA